MYLLQNYDEEPIVNIGWGEDLTIRELAETGHVGDWLQRRINI